MKWREDQKGREIICYYMNRNHYTEKENLKDMVLVAINEITKFDPDKTDKDKEDFGVEFSNIAPFNPVMIKNVLIELGYEAGYLDENGWDGNYWCPFIHPDKKHFPPVRLTGTTWIHKCQLHGMYDDCEVYPHLEDNLERNTAIKRLFNTEITERNTILPFKWKSCKQTAR